MSSVQSAGVSTVAIGRALIANSTATSQAIPTTPTAFVWPNVRNSNPDPQYDSSTGYFTFIADCFFNSVASWTLTGSASRVFYADAETSVDGGITWVRGTESLRAEDATSAGVTLMFPFSGFFPKGLMLRFVAWANNTGVTITTTTVSGSTAPAARLTTNCIFGSKV